MNASRSEDAEKAKTRPSTRDALKVAMTWPYGERIGWAKRRLSRLLQQMLGGDELARGGHAGAGQPHRQSQRRRRRHRTGQVAVVGWGGVLVEGTEFVLFVLELFVAVAAQFAVGAGFVRAAVSGWNLSACGLLVAHMRQICGTSAITDQAWAGRTYWARLSDLEKALLQCGQMYGRSCVCVLTCLAARTKVKQSAAAEIKMRLK